MVNNSGEIAELRSRVASLEQKLQTHQVQLQQIKTTAPGPTTNYQPVMDQYSGANISDGQMQVGAGGLAGQSVIILRKSSDGSLIGTIGYWIDGSNVLHEGINMTSLALVKTALDAIPPATTLITTATLAEGCRTALDAILLALYS